MEKERTNGEEDFRIYRFKYLTEIFTFLSKSGDMEEKINKKVQSLKSSKSNRKCDSCGTIYGGLKRKCDVCKDHVSKIVYDEERIGYNDNLPKYFDIGQKTQHNPVSITMGETILVNPNSFENVKTILDDIKEGAIREETKWVFVGSAVPRIL